MDQSPTAKEEDGRLRFPFWRIGAGLQFLAGGLFFLRAYDSSDEAFLISGTCLYIGALCSLWSARLYDPKPAKDSRPAPSGDDRG